MRGGNVSRYTISELKDEGPNLAHSMYSTNASGRISILCPNGPSLSNAVQQVEEAEDGEVRASQAFGFCRIYGTTSVWEGVDECYAGILISEETM